MAIAPFAYERLPQLTRAQASGASALARGFVGLSIEAAVESLSRVIGGRVSVTPLAVELWPPGSALTRPDPSLVAIVIGDAVATPRVVLELDAPFAGFLVDRALGATQPEPRLWPGPSTDGERGTLAFLAALALTHDAGRHRVVGVVSTVAAFAHALEGAEGLLLAHPARLELDGAHGWARLWMAPETAQSDGSPALDPTLELSLSLIAAKLSLPARDVSALAVGDVVIPEQWTARTEDGRWTGELRAVSALDGRSLVLDASPACTLRRVDVETVVGGRTMSSGERSGPVTDPKNVADVPVELTIEIGRLALSVGELSQLAPGAVVASGVPAGGLVLLRAGSRVIGRGELVVVDGELGVRLTEMG